MMCWTLRSEQINPPGVCMHTHNSADTKSGKAAEQHQRTVVQRVDRALARDTGTSERQTLVHEPQSSMLQSDCPAPLITCCTVGDAKLPSLTGGRG
jgi:hypothetical protein